MVPTTYEGNQETTIDMRKMNNTTRKTTTKPAKFKKSQEDFIVIPSPETGVSTGFFFVF